jgi:glycerophosphoryl diester phosphodiesterase
LQRAIEEGADFIETDILASKDGHLTCFHDVTLDVTTDVANRTEFAKRKKTYEVEGENVTGWFVGMNAIPCDSEHLFLLIYL